MTHWTSSMKNRERWSRWWRPAFWAVYSVDCGINNWAKVGGWACCLPSLFLSFIDSILQVLIQMTPHSSLPSSSLWPCDSAGVNGMWRSDMATSKSCSTRKLLALCLLSFSFPQAETYSCPHQPQPHKQGQRLWEQWSRDAWPSGPITWKKNIPLSYLFHI